MLMVYVDITSLLVKMFVVLAGGGSEQNYWLFIADITQFN